MKIERDFNWRKATAKAAKAKKLSSAGRILREAEYLFNRETEEIKFFENAFGLRKDGEAK